MSITYKHLIFPHVIRKIVVQKSNFHKMGCALTKKKCNVDNGLETDDFTLSVPISSPNIYRNLNINEEVPYEIIQMIIRFVPHNDLKNCYNTCRYWRMIIKDYFKLKGKSRFCKSKLLVPSLKELRCFRFQNCHTIRRIEKPCCDGKT